MITEENGMVKIDIEEEDLLEATAWLMGLKEFCEKSKNDEMRGSWIRHIETAIETMKAFWTIVFGEPGEDMDENN